MAAGLPTREGEVLREGGAGGGREEGLGKGARETIHDNEFNNNGVITPTYPKDLAKGT